MNEVTVTCSPDWLGMGFTSYFRLWLTVWNYGSTKTKDLFRPADKWFLVWLGAVYGTAQPHAAGI